MEAAIRTANREAVQQYYANNNPNGFLMINGVRTTPLIWAIDNGKYSIAKLLIDLGANPNLYVQAQGQIAEKAPLISAIKIGNVTFINWLLGHGANVNMANGNALHYFLGTNWPKMHPELIQTFLQAGAVVNAQDAKSRTPLMILAKKPDITTSDLVKALLDAGADITIKDTSDKDALQVAIDADNFSFVQQLIETPTFKLLENDGGHLLKQIKSIVDDIEREIESQQNNYNNNYGPPRIDRTLANKSYAGRQLITAMQDKLKEEKVQERLRIKALLGTVEGKSDEEKAIILQQAIASLTKIMHPAEITVFQQVVHNGDIDMIKLLIDAGIDVNERAPEGSLTLEIAIRSQHSSIEMLQALVNAGADVNQLGESGFPPAMEAVRESNHEALDFLLDNGATMNIEFLMSAVYRGIHDMIDHLIERGADINEATDDTGETALTMAISEQKRESAIHLINLGANVNLSDTKYAPLHYAILNNEPGMVQELLVAGADPTTPAVVDGETPLMMATRLGNDEIVTMLQEYLAPHNQAASQKKWKGFSRGDAERFDTLFETEAPVGQRAPAENFSCCPICLKYVQRESGCMYMTHNCSLSGRYHPELYRKYRGFAGTVEWCSICGRIANGSHAHYAVGPWDGPKPEILYGGGPFDQDCRTTSRGGGIPEKFMRARAIREEGARLNALVDQITDQEAFMRLVEAAWNAPATQSANTIATIISGKAWNKPSSNYPVIRPNNNAPAPNANDPTAYEQPVILLPKRGEVPANEGYEGNLASLDTDIPVIVFRHKNKDGEMHTHQQIGLDSITTHLSQSGAKNNICFDEHECGGLFWPRELELAFADPKLAPYITPELRTMLEHYKVRFNNAMKAAANAAAAAGAGAGEGAGAEGGRRQVTRRAKAVTRRRQPRNKSRRRK